jgi:hypothetical protein
MRYLARGVAALLLAAAASVAIAVAAGPVSALTIEVEPGTVVEISEPAGFCALNRNGTTAEREAYRPIDAAETGSHQVLAFFGPCAGIEAIRNGAELELDRWIVVVTSIKNGAPLKVTGSRKEMIAGVGSAMSSDKGGGERSAKTGSDRINEIFGNNISIGLQRSLGELGRDENGLYLGMAINSRVADQERRLAAIISITLIDAVVINVNLYKHYTEPADFDRLLQQARAITSDLVQRNDPTEFRKSGGRGYFDWGKIAWNALIGGLVATLVVGVVVLWRRMRGPKRPLG